MRKEVALIGEWVPELANWAVNGLEDVLALNNVPNVIFVNRL